MPKACFLAGPWLPGREITYSSGQGCAVSPKAYTSQFPLQPWVMAVLQGLLPGSHDVRAAHAGFAGGLRLLGPQKP